MANTDLPNLQQRGKVQIVRRDTTHIPDEYNMTHRHRGVALIINNRDFTTLGVECRGGTEGDGWSIAERLKELGFEIRSYMNQTKARMEELMKNVSREDHSENDCFACVILSHGEKDTVHGTDGPIEACRGSATDYGADVTDDDVTDSLAVAADGDDEEGEEEPVTYRIPTEADFLLAYSVVSGYYSWRHTIEGSLFIQALCEILEMYGTTLDLMTMMTRVNKMVAYGFEVHEVKSIQRPYVYKMKQIPSVLSMLTKDVYFRPKD